mgnify:CR=1 FL=1
MHRKTTAPTQQRMMVEVATGLVGMSGGVVVWLAGVVVTDVLEVGSEGSTTGGKTVGQMNLKQP